MLKAKLKTIGSMVCPMACLMMIALGASACRQDMHDNPKYKPYREGANRQLPDGTVARGSLDMNPAGPKITQAAASTRPPDSNPCSNGRSVWVNDNCAIHDSSPGLPATVKSRTHDPIVTASAIIAAVAALSAIDAENSASAPTSRP